MNRAAFGGFCLLFCVVAFCVNTDFQANASVNTRINGSVMANAARIIYAKCEVSSWAVLTQFRAADGRSRLRIRGEASRGDGGGGRLVKQMIGGC